MIMHEFDVKAARGSTEQGVCLDDSLMINNRPHLSEKQGPVVEDRSRLSEKALERHDRL